MRRVAMLSVHTSPLAHPGVACDVLTRAEHAEQPPVVVVEPGFRVVHVPAGPAAPVPKHDLPGLVEPFSDAVLDHLDRCGGDYAVLHANYWVSGAVGHRLKHELDLPLVATFHTLDRVKAEAGVGDDPETRARVEGEIVNCADLMVTATDEERDQLVTLYGAEPNRVEVVPPGVDHHVFAPGDRAEARRPLRLDPEGRVLLYVGRIQPLKGADLAVRCLAELDPDVTLLVVGADVGGLGSVVADGDTGFLVEGRAALDYAAPVDLLLSDDELAREMSAAALARSSRYMWSIAAARLRRLYGDLAARAPLQCT